MSDFMAKMYQLLKGGERREGEGRGGEGKGRERGGEGGGEETMPYPFTPPLIHISGYAPGK